MYPRLLFVQENHPISTGEPSWCADLPYAARCEAVAFEAEMIAGMEYRREAARLGDARGDRCLMQARGEDRLAALAWLRVLNWCRDTPDVPPGPWGEAWGRMAEKIGQVLNARWAQPSTGPQNR